MKDYKDIKKYPFLFIIILSTVLLSLIGTIEKNTVYAGYSVKLLKTPQLAVVFEGIGEGRYPWSMAASESEDAEYLEEQVVTDESSLEDDNEKEDTSDIQADNQNGNQAVSNETITEGDDSDSNEADVEEASSDNAEKEEPDQEDTDSEKADNEIVDNKETDREETAKNEEDNVEPVKQDEVSNRTDEKAADQEKAADEDTSKEEHSKTDEVLTDDQFQTVTLEYFDDALFIGDSRTVGLSEYSGWSNPTYYANEGLTIYDVMDKKIAEVNGHKKTLVEALKKHKFKKIYIMLGINELGRGTTDTFTDEYSNVIKKLRKLQPDAIIFVQGIMNVAKKKSDADPIFNNINIKDRNDSIAKLADNKHIFYIDVNVAITDDTGGIPSEYTFDDIHLKAAYYKIWTDFLMKHGIVLN